MQLWESEEGQIYNKWIAVSEDIPGMYADMDKPAKYYCEQDPKDKFLKPTYYCNTINSDGKFDERDSKLVIFGDKPTWGDCKQCDNDIWIYTTMHECSPSQCDNKNGNEIGLIEKQKLKKEFKDLYKGNFVHHEGEIEYNDAAFMLFEIKFLFQIFIILNSFQSAAFFLKFVKVILKAVRG